MDPMSQTKAKSSPSSASMSRRVFLHRGSALIGGAALATTFLGCGGSEEPAGFTCTTGLTAQQTSMRQAMAYTDTGTDPAKLCKDCNFFPDPAPTTACGDCTLQLGAVHPMGSCTSFAARQG
jgi:hypothetical protein